MKNIVTQIITYRDTKKAYLYSSNKELQNYIQSIDFSHENVSYFTKGNIIESLWKLLQDRKEDKYRRFWFKNLYVILDNVEDIVNDNDPQFIELLKDGGRFSINFILTSRDSSKEELNSIIDEIKQYSSLDIFVEEKSNDLYSSGTNTPERRFSIGEELKSKMPLTSGFYKKTSPLVGFDINTNASIHLDEDKPNALLFGKSRDPYIPGTKFNLIASLIDQLSHHYRDNQIYYCSKYSYHEQKLQDRIPYAFENIYYYSEVDETVSKVLRIQNDRLYYTDLFASVLRESGLEHYLYSFCPYFHDSYLIIEKTKDFSKNTILKLKEVLEKGHAVGVYVVVVIDEDEKDTIEFIKENNLNFNMHIVYSKTKPTIEIRQLENERVIKENTVVLEYYGI